MAGADVSLGGKSAGDLGEVQASLDGKGTRSNSAVQKKHVAKWFVDEM